LKKPLDKTEKTPEEMEDNLPEATSDKASWRLAPEDRELARELAKHNVPQCLIARAVGCSQANVSQITAKVRAEKKELQEFREVEADVFTSKKVQLFKKVSNETIQKIPVETSKDLREVFTSIGILQDHENKLRGRATHIFAHQEYLDEKREAEELAQEILMEKGGDGVYSVPDEDEGAQP
jgi:predicted transcriptional regulator